MKIIFLIIWIIYSFAEGKRDGSFYHLNMISPNPIKENLHWLFSLMRGIVLGLITWLCMIKFLFFIATIYTLSLIVMFSFIHNGIYYYTRNKLNPNIYQKRFWDSSTSSTSFIELNPITRTIMFVIGLVGILITVFIK